MVNNKIRVLVLTMHWGVNMLRNSTCFKLKAEHENLHRNKAKIKVLSH
jgi:hypothetical protein